MEDNAQGCMYVDVDRIRPPFSFTLGANDNAVVPLSNRIIHPIALGTQVYTRCRDTFSAQLEGHRSRSTLVFIKYSYYIVSSPVFGWGLGMLTLLMRPVGRHGV